MNNFFPVLYILYYCGCVFASVNRVLLEMDRVCPPKSEPARESSKKRALCVRRPMEHRLTMTERKSVAAVQCHTPKSVFDDGGAVGGAKGMRL